ncbi:hypothetical protein [Streptomyces sp. NPDC050504]|uniref:hypothetical protein n=1 Tax=Streptomyces sp. NPDC050504 TaxID=3365618 RepID=UPI0037985DA3
MSTSPSDRDLWQAYEDAHSEMSRYRAEFDEHAKDRTEILRAALGSGPRAIAALDFLEARSGDGSVGLALLPELVEWTRSHRYARFARQAINAIPSERLLPVLEPLILERLDSADGEEYLRYAELLFHIEARELLGRLTARALASDDPDTREVGEDYTQ